MKTLLLTTALVVAASGAHASTFLIDFEAGPENLSLGTGPVDLGFGVTATSTENMQLVATGEPTDGFVPDDMPVDDSFGDFFLTGDFSDNTDLTLSFDTAVRGLTFDIADIDGSGTSVTNSTEFFSFIASFNGGTVEEIYVDATEVTGDAQIVEITFGADVVIDMVEIVGVTRGGTRNIGWGIDNISASAVPLPAAGWLLIGAFGGLAAMKRRKKAA